MAQTPPPPEEARTPPTPLHGPMFDTSPRRSSRIHSKQKHNLDSKIDSPPASMRARPTARSTSSQALSPPTSPISPDQRSQLAKRNQALAHIHSHSSAKPPRVSLLGVEQASNMYPTPAKTPRKRKPTTNFGNTARVLFHDRETNPNDIMPTPSKSRKGKKHTAFSLESFEEEQKNGNRVKIYTDSKERMPELDKDDDNPFVVQGGTSQPQKVPAQKRGRPKHGVSQGVDDAVENDRGIVYTFRGRKVFRKFDNNSDNEPIQNDEDPAGTFSDQDLVRRQAGHESRKRLTRSSVKPRLLFPPKQPEFDEYEGSGDDPNEATTDIETPADTPEEPIEEPDTPHEQSFGVSTPPATEETKKRSPFDSWPRTKPGRSGRSKRPGSPLEKTQGATGKRSKSTQPG